MSIVPARHSAAETVAKNGLAASLFTGRAIETLRGYDQDPTKMRGYRRGFLKHGHGYRPGAYSPKVTRVGVAKQAPSTVGTTMVLGGLDAMKERSLVHGPAGSKKPYGRHMPKWAGQDPSDRVGLDQTPAFGVVETAFARTGVPTLWSKFAAPRGQVPNGMPVFDPVPAYTHVPLGAIVRTPNPVGCLPGTPGCFVDPTGRTAGLRRPWWQTQNEGSRSRAVFAEADSPIVTDRNVSSSYAALGPVALPINHPGTRHAMDATGGSSYQGQPNYPSASSPWGYKGADRTQAEPVMPSVADAPLHLHEAKSAHGQLMTKRFFIGAAVIAALALAGRR